jgi:hypothetical protein
MSLDKLKRILENRAKLLKKKDLLTLDLNNYDKITYINRRKSATYTEYKKIKDNEWSLMKYNEGIITDKDTVDDDFLRSMLRLYVNFARGGSVIQYGNNVIEIHTATRKI